MAMLEYCIAGSAKAAASPYRGKQLEAQSLRYPHLFVWFTSAIVTGLFACGQAKTSTPAATRADAAELATGGGGGAGGTRGTTGGVGGGTTSSGGATGMGSAGGSTRRLDSSTISSGGNTTGTGGSISETGGGKTDGSPSATGGSTAVADSGSAKDGGNDVQPSKDDPLDTGPAMGDGDGGINIPDGYKLVWSDEFNTEGTPDPKNWNYEKGFVRNNELQWYQSNNAIVKGGMLIIEGRKEQVANPNYSAGGSDWKTNRQYAQYTSSSMTTSSLQIWQYGRFEMRARIPSSAGMWPAWWTLGVRGEWPSNGEIDIMEYYKGNVLANVACGTATRGTPKWDSSSKATSSLGANWASSFHVWRMDWDDQDINLYLDDTLMNGVALSSMLNSDGTSPFKQKVYMILNLAIGGDNGGDPSSTTFPVKFEVDYVRVFQKL
jgi:beta-glucanase (GH16 family)